MGEFLELQIPDNLNSQAVNQLNGSSVNFGGFTLEAQINGSLGGQIAVAGNLNWWEGLGVGGEGSYGFTRSINNNGTISESIVFRVADNAASLGYHGLLSFSFTVAPSTIQMSGFAQDPMATVEQGSANYNAGTLVCVLTGSGNQTIVFNNKNATPAGTTLTISNNDISSDGNQFGLLQFTYSNDAYTNRGATLLENPFFVHEGVDTGNKVPVYDGAVERYNGVYYLFGIGSAGQVYASKDMATWKSPVEWLSPTDPNIPSWVGKDPWLTTRTSDSSRYPYYGAGDIFFHNGIMFWCFNTIAIAGGDPSTLNSANPDFRHLSPDHPYSRGIDGQFYVSHTGELLYIRKVQPRELDRGDGTGEAWVFELGDSIFDEPFQREIDDPNWGHELLFGEKGHWDNFDFHNFECPELFYKNGQYYLLYCGNKLNTETGLYDTGVAQNSDWRNIRNADKYPGKLLARNQEKFLLRYNIIMPTCEHGGWNYAYTFNSPSADWKELGYNDASWNHGEGGFGWPILKDNSVLVDGLTNAGETDESNIWGGNGGPQQIWVRRTFTLDRIPQATVLRHRISGTGTIYVNGVALVNSNGYSRSYSMTEIPADLLQTGENVVSASVYASTQQDHIDFGVFDTRGLPVEPDIVGTAQPHLVTGRNGFQDWILYKGIWNGINGQGKSRIFFWDDEMVADGPHSGASADFPTEDTPPTLFNSFDGHANGAVFVEATNATETIAIPSGTAENLFAEVNIKFEENPGPIGRAGIEIWKKDVENWVRVFIERTQPRVLVEYQFDGVEGNTAFPLPSSFAYQETNPMVADIGEQYHTLKVYKNGTNIFAQIDHYWANNDQPILQRSELAEPGSTSLVAFQSRNWFDNLTISKGWDERGERINGWTGGWVVSPEGITSPAMGTQIAIKGEPMLESECSAYLKTSGLSSEGDAGLIPAYIDDNNKVEVVINQTNRMIECWSTIAGQRRLLDANVLRRDTIYGYSNFEGETQTKYEFELRGKVHVSRVRPLWCYGENLYMNQFYRLPNTSLSSFGIDIWRNDSWEAITYDYQSNGRGRFSDAIFNTVEETSRIRLRVPSGINRPFAFAVREEISTKNFIRILRQGRRIYVWLNNQLMMDVEDTLQGQLAKVGLYSKDMSCTFNNITAFEIGESDNTNVDVPNETSVAALPNEYLFGSGTEKPRTVTKTEGGKDYFGVRFNRRTNDDRLNYQLLGRSPIDRINKLIWSDTLAPDEIRPINETFEEVTIYTPIGTNVSEFFEVKVNP